MAESPETSAPPPRVDFVSVVEVSLAGALVPAAAAAFRWSHHTYRTSVPDILVECVARGVPAFVVGFLLAVPVAAVVVYLGPTLRRLFSNPWILGLSISVAWIGGALLVVAEPTGPDWRELGVGSWISFAGAPLVAGLAAAANRRGPEDAEGERKSR